MAKTVKLVATRTQRFENRVVQAGEHMMATPAVAKTLLAIKRAENYVEGKVKKAKPAEAPAPVAAETQQPAQPATAQASSTAVAPMTTGTMGADPGNEYERRDMKAKP